MDKITTLPELKRVYVAARRAMIERKNREGKTQTVAAQELGVTLNCLNAAIHREGIQWRVIRPGQRKGTTKCKS